MLGGEQLAPARQDLGILAGEHDAGVAVHRHLARDGGPRDRGDAHPGAQLLGEAGGECPGQDGEVAVIVGLHG